MGRLAANEDVMRWVLTIASERQIELEAQIQGRRSELKSRAFYIAD